MKGTPLNLQTQTPRVHFASTKGEKVRDKSATDNSGTNWLSKEIQHASIKRWLMTSSLKNYVQKVINHLKFSYGNLEVRFINNLEVRFIYNILIAYYNNLKIKAVKLTCQ